MPSLLKFTNKTHPKKGLPSICDDHILQYSHPGKSGECDLVIGLDFGTSASKVVIQAPDLPGSPGYPVDFSSLGHYATPVLLPSRLWIDSNGTCYLKPKTSATAVSDIKLSIFTSSDELNTSLCPMKLGLSPDAVAISYLALILRYARKWILETKQDILKDFSKIQWSFNMGVPSPCIEDNPAHRRFEYIGKAAWMLSTLSAQGFTLDKAHSEFKHVKEPGYWAEDNEFVCDFEIIPEIAAGAVGYALSNLRREGLHVMIDIGASTIDCCSFILHKPYGSDRYSLLTADVKLLGAIIIHNERINAIQRIIANHTQKLRNEYDPMTPISENIHQYILPNETIKFEVKEAESRMQKKCMTMIRRVVWDAKMHRDPNAKVWNNGRLPILLIGGGSQLSFYHSSIQELDIWLKTYTKNNGAQFLSVPIPSSLSQNTSAYHRLAVAWGLSHRALDIGDITPADRIKDIDNAHIIDWEQYYVGKEQV